MNMKKKFGFLFLLMLLITITIYGCTKSEPDDIDDISGITDDMYEKVTNVYGTYQLETPENIYYSEYYDAFSNGEVCMFGTFPKGNSAYNSYVLYDSEGKIKEFIDIPIIPDTGILLTAKLSNNNHVIVTAKNLGMYGSEGIIYIVSPDGDIIYEDDYIYEFGDDLYVTQNDEIYLSMGRMLYIYDSELNNLHVIEHFSTIDNIVSDNNGNVMVNWTYAPEYYTVNRDRGILEQYQPPIKADHPAKLIFGKDGNMYYADKIGIYRVSDMEQILSWANSYLLYDHVRIKDIVSEDFIIGEIYDSFSSRYDCSILKRTPDDEIEPRVNIKLVITGFDSKPTLNEAANLFNRDNDTYRVIIEDYTVYNKAPEHTQAVDMINQDMLKGTLPDIVFLDYMMMKNIEMYTEKGVFIDLNQYINNSDKFELLKCVSSSFSMGGKMYHLPIRVALETLAGKTSLIGENEKLTLDKMYSLADNVQGNESLFSVKLELINTALYDFIDYNTKTCNFESGEFIRLLNFMYNIDDYIDVEKGRLHYFYDSYFYSTDKLYQSLQDDELYLLHLPMNTIEGYVLAKLFYGDDDFSIYGYPSDSGFSSNISCDYTLAITEQSKVKAGAWEFIEFLLSDKIQTSDNIIAANLPVTVSGIEKLLECSEYYIFLQPSNNSLYTDPRFDLIKSKEVYEDHHPYSTDADYHLTLTDSDKKKLMSYFNETEIKSFSDKTIAAIVEEEYYSFINGVISAEEAAKIIQNRVFTYINE